MWATGADQLSAALRAGSSTTPRVSKTVLRADHICAGDRRRIGREGCGYAMITGQGNGQGGARARPEVRSTAGYVATSRIPTSQVYRRDVGRTGGVDSAKGLSAVRWLKRFTPAKSRPDLHLLQSHCFASRRQLTSRRSGEAGVLSSASTSSSPKPRATPTSCLPVR